MNFLSKNTAQENFQINRNKLVLLALIIFIVFSCKIKPDENDSSNKVRTFISILDYIGTDYNNAVINGKIINAPEFGEMNDFINNGLNLYNSFKHKIDLKSRNDISTDLYELKKLIIGKAEAGEVLKQSNKIKSEILRLNLIVVSPKQWPDIINGEKIYNLNCASCHGNNGNGQGILSKNLHPRPANFLNDTLMNTVSPLQVYNTVKSGISGTGMPSFNNLSDQNTWDAAYYVNALRYKGKSGLDRDTLSGIYEQISKRVTLNDVSVLSDRQLIEKLSGNPDRDSLHLAAIRLHESNSAGYFSIEITNAYLDDVLKNYQNDNIGKAYEISLTAYLQGVEPFEQQLQAMNPGLKNQIESIMSELRSDIKDRKPVSTIQFNIIKAKSLIAEAASELSNKKFTFWFAFLLAASIILREGLEAFLIIITMLGVLKSTGAVRAAKWVHGGWVTALFLGIAGMFFIDTLISFNPRNRELMEGFGSLFAVVLLLYIGFWLHNKTEAKKWKEFVENKIVKAINGRNIFGLALMSFIVVFREAFESVIFLSTIDLEANHTGINGIYFGAASALIFVLFLSWLVVKFAVKLPVVKLFKYSAIIIVTLSVVITGKAIHAFQESGYLNSTHLLTSLRFEYLGIYPTIETTISQILVFALTTVLWRFGGRISLKA